MSKNQKRLEKIEGICIGAGFLLQKLRAEYGADLSIGMEAQINDCISDCNRIAKSVSQREHSKSQEVV